MVFFLAAAANIAIAFVLGTLTGGAIVWWRMTGTKGRIYRG